MDRTLRMSDVGPFGREGFMAMNEFHRALGKERTGILGLLRSLTANMLERFRTLTRRFNAMKLKNDKPLQDLLDDISLSLQSLLQAGGASASEARDLARS